MKLKRTLALLMALCMLIGMVPVVGVSAEEYPAITPDTEQTVTISEGGEIAYFAYTPAYTESYTFYSAGNQDVYGYIYDSEMNQLASDDDSAGNGQFAVTYTLEAGKTYIFAGRFYSSGATGSFSIMLNANHSSAVEGVVTKEVTCTEDGIMTYTCDACGTIFNEIIPGGHVWDEDELVCARCGEEFYAEGTCGDNVTWTLDKTGTMKISGTGEMYNCDWWYNRAPWYEYYEVTKAVQVEDGVTSVGEHAFFGFENITHVDLADSVTSIGYHAFNSCSNLGSINLPDGLTYIGSNAFSYCSSLASVDIPSSVTDIGASAFNGCSSITSIDLPDNLTSVVDSTFYDCSSLASIDLPDNLTSIGDYAFRNCDKLTDIDLPDNLTSIGDGAFYSCDGLTSIGLRDSLTSIGDSAFADCDSLTNINLPNSLNYIGEGAFHNCNGLKSIDIPEGITTIRYNTFSSCYALESVTLPDSLRKISYSAFAGCWSLANIDLPDGIISIGNSAFIDCYNLTRIEIPAGLTFIDDALFANCSNLKEIVFKGNAPTITSTAFNNVTANAYYPAGNETWTTDVLQNYGGNITWIAIPEDCLAGNHVFTDYIPDGNGTCLADGTKTAKCDHCDATDTIADPDSKTDHRYSHYVYDADTNTSTAYCDYGCGTSTTVAGHPVIIADTVQPVTIAEGGEQAYFAFTPAYTESYTFYSFGDSDTYGYLYDSEMNQLTYNDDGAGNGQFSITYDLEAGKTYILGARYYSSYATGSFSVVLQTNHSAAEGVVTKEPTCTEDGIMTYHCDVCGTELTETIPGGHVWGEAELVCTRCGEEFRVEGICGDNLTWVLDKTGTLTISGTGQMDNWDYLYYYVPWYDYREMIKTVVLEDGVSSIGNYAFYDCSLTSINLPDSVTSIGDSAFYGCSSLTSVDLGNSVTSISKYAFYECINLTSIELPDSVTSISDWAFESCSSLTSIDLPDNVTSIGDVAFQSCSSLTSVDLGNSVTSIGDDAFRGCSSLTSIDLPDSVTSIGYAAFSGCSSLTSVDLGDGVTSIGDWAFSHCISLTSIDLPDSVTSIGYAVFYECISLTSIDLPDSVTSIGADAFQKCSSLTSVDLGDGVTSIGDYAFYDCSSLANIDLGNSLISIGTDAFRYCSSLTSIDLPDSVISIGDYAFYDCSSLTSVDLGDSVTSIGAWAFSDCISLTSIDLPDGVTSIGDWAFESCSSLTSIDLSDSLSFIGERAFTSCRSLTSIDIPDGITTIRYSTFEGCSDLVSVNLPDSLKKISYSVFAGCSSLRNINLPDGITSIGNSAFIDCYNLTRIEIPAALTFIDNALFANCSNLREIVFKGNAPVISDIAFNNVTANAYYPAGNETWTADVMQNYGGNITWIVVSEDCMAGNHVFTNYISDGNGTCLADGTKTAKCDHCYVTDTVAEPGSRTDHKYGDLVVNTDSFTCTGSCIWNCGATTSVEIPEMVDGKVYPASIVANGDYAYFRYTPAYTEECTFFSYGDKDTYGYIYDSNMNLLASNDDDDEYGNFAVFYTLEAGKTYILAARFDSFNTTGEFPVVLSVRHVLDWDRAVTIKEATCVESGEQKVPCAICGEEINVTIRATDHEWDENLQCIKCDEYYFVEGDMGNISEDLHWSLDHTGTLTISGNGGMDCAQGNLCVPWFCYSDMIQVKKVIVESGVTEICCFIFNNNFCPAQISSVEIADTVTHIGRAAFSNCTELTSITIPQNVTTIGGLAFADCSNLNAIYFTGDAPEFTDPNFAGEPTNDTFEGVTATAYYPAGNETWTADVMQNYGGNITWVVQHEMLDGDGSVVQMGDTPELEIRAAGEIEKFEGVTVDGELVDPSNYTVTEGSTIVTFKPEYLKTLEEGDHTITVHFTDGVAIAEVSVEKPTYILGDVNSDGVVNAHDRVFLARYLAKWTDYPASVINMAAADVNGDGAVNAHDRVYLARHLAKWSGYETLGG